VSITEPGLKGSSWLITGGARGIGEAIARAASGNSAKVVIGDLTNEAGEALAASLRNAGGEVIYRPCDVTSTEDLAAAVATAGTKHGGLDVLVNNAGIHDRMVSAGTDLESMDPAAFRKVIEVNLVAIWTATKIALPLLKRSRNPSVINAASTAALTGYPSAAAYGASKGGVGILTKCLAVDLAVHGIRVNAYCPGATETEMMADLFRRQPDEATVRSRSISTHLVHRMGRPADIAELVCFLASERAAFITGALIPVDGGSLAWRGSYGDLKGTVEA